MFALMLFVGLNNNSAHAKYMGHHETPTELRGNWYSWDPYSHKLNHMHFYKYTIYVNGKKAHKLNNIQQMKGVYNLFGFKQGDVSMYTLTNKKVHGRKTMVVQNQLWIRDKSHHEYYITGK